MISTHICPASCSTLRMDQEFPSDQPVFEFPEFEKMKNTLNDFHSLFCQSEDDLIQQGINFVEIETECLHIIAELDRVDTMGPSAAPQVAKNTMISMRRHAEEILKSIHCDALKAIFKMQKKAIGAGFPCLCHDPKALEFACRSKLLYTMQMYQNSAQILEHNDIAPRLSGQNEVLFKVQGKFVPYREIANTIIYSQESGKFTGWSFTHPNGFVPVDSYDFSKIHPIAKLSQKAVAQLQEHALKFGSQSPTDEGAAPKHHVFQIVTSGNRYFETYPWAKNLREWLPEHASMRLITPEGKVYSCGTKLRKQDQKISWSTFLATKITKLPIPDYTETYPYAERLVTSIPASQEEAGKLLRFFEQLSKGVPFCFPSQNCTRATAVAASLIGQEIPVQMTARELVWNALPDLQDIPLIGSTAAFIASLTARIVRPVFGLIAAFYVAVVPEQFRYFITIPARLLQDLMQKVASVCLNILSIPLGSMKALPRREALTKGGYQRIPEKFLWFTQLLQWKDIFKEDAIPIFHSTLLKQWQRSQPTTISYLQRNKIDLSILPYEAEPDSIRGA